MLWWSKPTPTFPAPRRSSQLGKYQKALLMCVRPVFETPTAVSMLSLTLLASPLQEVLNAKDAAQDTLQEAEGKYDAACVALKAALSEAAARQEIRKCVKHTAMRMTSRLTAGAPHHRRSSRLEPSAPERTSARVASRPKKTYAEDDVFSDDDDFRDGGLGADAACGLQRARACGAHAAMLQAA